MPFFIFRKVLNAVFVYVVTSLQLWSCLLSLF